jgi:hypothetical protein
MFAHSPCVDPRPEYLAARGVQYQAIFPSGTAMSLPATTTRPRQRRTRGGITLPRTDGRTIAARRFRDLVDTFTAELGSGLTEADKSLTKQAANLVLASERMQADVVAGATVDPDALVRVSSEARRILGMLRAKVSKAKPAVPTTRERLLGDPRMLLVWYSGIPATIALILPSPISSRSFARIPARARGRRGVLTSTNSVDDFRPTGSGGYTSTCRVRWMVRFSIRQVFSPRIESGRRVLPPQKDTLCFGFVDMSGGSSDDATLAISHRENGKTVIDLVINQMAAFRSIHEVLSGNLSARS